MFLRVQAHPCSRQESRALSFSEEKTHWQLPMSDVNIICDVTTRDGTSSTLSWGPNLNCTRERRSSTAGPRGAVRGFAELLFD